MRIVLSSDPRLLHVLRSVIKCCAEGAGFPDSDAESLAMAIDEAAANVIRHTYANRPDAKLALEIRTFPDHVEFILEDWGPKVHSELIRPRPLDEIRPGGLGTFFIQRFMDESSYDGNCPEGNRLRMIKNLPRKVSSHDEG